MSVVSYDSGMMIKLANELKTNVESFKAQNVKGFFEKMAAEIGIDESHPTWYGDLAQQFYDMTIEAKRKEFETACNNVISYADNFLGQGKSWDSFENGQ